LKSDVASILAQLNTLQSATQLTLEQLTVNLFKNILYVWFVFCSIWVSFFLSVKQSWSCCAQVENTFKRMKKKKKIEKKKKIIFFFFKKKAQIAVAADTLLVAWSALVVSSGGGGVLNRSDSNIESTSSTTITSTVPDNDTITPPLKKPRVETTKANVSSSPLSASSIVASATAGVTGNRPVTATAVATTAPPPTPIRMTDPVRERAAQMLAEALTPPPIGEESAATTTTTTTTETETTVTDELLPPQVERDVPTMAMAIEKALFDKYKGDTSKDYKQQLRSLHANLKNKKNPGLRTSIMVGELVPTDFVNMSVHQLANAELVEQRRKDAEWAKLVAMGPSQNVAAPTDAFQCGRCKQRYVHEQITMQITNEDSFCCRKCRYFMMQIRSADEPMTTFINCANCGHNWRLN
jgi:DNA-directed RNA polymerase subunit M/transcription elongation factor TFIIS